MGTIHEFKGLEAPAVILTDVDLSKQYHRGLLYVGASWATDRLVVLNSKSSDVQIAVRAWADKRDCRWGVTSLGFLAYIFFTW